MNVFSLYRVSADLPESLLGRREDKPPNMKRCITVMIAICHIQITELSYALLPGKKIETVCSERAGNKSVKLAL